MSKTINSQTKEIDKILENFGIEMVNCALDNLHPEIKSTIKVKYFIEDSKSKVIKSILALKQKWQREELGKILIRHQENLLLYTDDIESDDLVIYLNDRIKELGDSDE